MNCIPLGRKLLVKREEMQSKIGSIYIPDKHQEKAQFARVMELGVGEEDGKPVSFNVKKGDRIIIPIYNHRERVVGDEGEFIVPHSDVLAICE